jgi:acyl-CoA thioesterase
MVTPVSQQQLAELVGDAMFRDDHCARAHGIVLEEIGPGRARMSMAVRADMANSHGICHGGMMFTLADACFAYACNSYNHAAVAAGCDIVFPNPAKLGDTLTAVAEEKHLKGRSGVYDVTVTTQDGTVVALFRGHCRRIQGAVIK